MPLNGCQPSSGGSVLGGVRAKSAAAAACPPTPRQPSDPGALPLERADAISAVFHAHYLRLLALARRLLADPADAEDVVMDAFVGLYRRWDGIRQTDNPYGYLRASVVNGSSNRRRSLRLAAARLFTQIEHVQVSTEQAALAEVARDELIPALRQLPDRQRQVLVLRYYEGLTETEIAATLGCGVGSVKTHASRGLRALQHYLEDPR